MKQLNTVMFATDHIAATPIIIIIIIITDIFKMA